MSLLVFLVKGLLWGLRGSLRQDDGRDAVQ